MTTTGIVVLVIYLIGCVFAYGRNTAYVYQFHELLETKPKSLHKEFLRFGGILTSWMSFFMTLANCYEKKHLNNKPLLRWSMKNNPFLDK